MKLKIEDKVKLLTLGSSIRNNSDFPFGAKCGDIVKITHIRFDGGYACKDDPRYCGVNFNIRGCHIEKIDKVIFISI